MRQISEKDFCDSIAATKKDAKLVAAAKNERTSTAESMYREFEKLTLDRRREIIIAIASEYFVAAAWRIAFPLNNFPAAILPDAILAAGKALFFTREEDCLRETIRAIRVYEKSPFVKRIASVLAEAAETTGTGLAKVASIFTDPSVFGIFRELDATSPASEKIVETVGRIASYTKDLDSTLAAARFLHARRYSKSLPEVASLLENTVFMARDHRSVQQILDGFSAGAIDVVLQRVSGNRQAIASIRDTAWKTRNANAIRTVLNAL